MNELQQIGKPKTNLRKRKLKNKSSELKILNKYLQNKVSNLKKETKEYMILMKCQVQTVMKRTLEIITNGSIQVVV